MYKSKPVILAQLPILDRDGDDLCDPGWNPDTTL